MKWTRSVQSTQKNWLVLTNSNQSIKTADQSCASFERFRSCWKCLENVLVTCFSWSKWQMGNYVRLASPTVSHWPARSPTSSHFAPILGQQWWQIIANPNRSPFSPGLCKLCRLQFSTCCIEWLREPPHFPPECQAQNKQSAALKLQLCRGVEQCLDPICNQSLTQPSCIGDCLESRFVWTWHVHW